MKARPTLLALLLLPTLLLTDSALASRYEIRQEIREGRGEVFREKLEARRELRRCTTSACARREIREGYREVNRERREARREVRREIRQDRRERFWREHDDDNPLLNGLVAGAAIVGVGALLRNMAND
ncbi:hypothetical protein [Crenobacter intestini]|uniref:Uncharacterized protein n=1 Tax=Crenobacter intestini TaxID=2563443 RepID=A0A4T0V3F6_9NEIS|nr:hypothetical protein [Crenobacter intestini]TIC86168.1 hypothetical protein E5K04_03425 [Crenobacter intestini]